MTTQQVFFVYVGGSLPAYATAALKLTRTHSGLEPHLLASSAALKLLPRGISQTTPIEDFYDASSFTDLKSKVMLAHRFREGFWLKSFERLVVLEQFMKFTNASSVFHAELDQLLFRVDLLIDKLNKLDSPGIRLPFHSPTSALASIMHIQGHANLTHLLEFARSTQPFMNEMELLARWGLANPERLQALPTLATVLIPDSRKLISPVSTLNLSDTGGISDAAQVGQWIGGVDARNLPSSKRPLNHHVDPASEMLLTKDQLALAKFSFERGSSRLQTRLHDGQLLPIYNLHLHSKAHRWVHAREQNLTFLIDRANRADDSAIPGVRLAQLSYKVVAALQTGWNSPQNAKSFLRMLANKYAHRRPSSAPFLSGDTFRGLTRNLWDSQSRSVKPSKLTEADLVFLEPELIEDFKTNILDKQKVPVTLMIGNSDINHGDNLKPLAQHPMVNRIFAQNLTKEVHGVEVLPIGLENRWRAANGLLSFFDKRLDVNAERKFRIMWCFSVHTNPEERVPATNDLSECQSADKYEDLPRKEHQDALRQYAFVASPPGNGLDTHRTWEAMYQGCVPVLLRSYLADTYRNLGLPVWIVDSYRELANLTEEQLKDKYLQMKPRFSSEILWFDYWKNRILNIDG
jgi:hypothetical protein